MGLTAVAIPNYERGFIIARSLIENISGKNNFEPMKIPAEIIWRKSVVSQGDGVLVIYRLERSILRYRNI
jgi:DNA-binding LacI/PurR family transcriptional regulator